MIIEKIANLLRSYIALKEQVRTGGGTVDLSKIEAAILELSNRVTPLETHLADLETLAPLIDEAAS